MKENGFQSKLIKEINELFPGCIVLKNDASYIQGFPDLLVLHNDRWAALECKRSEKASHQPNQDIYISTLDGMSYAAFVYPENKERVLNDLQRALRSKRKARNSKPE